MSGKHFLMCVDGNAGAFGWLEECFEFLEVVSRDHDGSRMRLLNRERLIVVAEGSRHEELLSSSFCKGNPKNLLNKSQIII